MPQNSTISSLPDPVAGLVRKGSNFERLGSAQVLMFQRGSYLLVMGSGRWPASIPSEPTAEELTMQPAGDSDAIEKDKSSEWTYP